jgi:molecular chaperone DnaJ
MSNYYDTLELTESATEKEVKDAYRKLARNYHPDINPDNAEAAEKFKQINEAYETLGNSDNRAGYDAMLHGHNFGSFGGFGDTFGGFDDLFESFFSGGNRRNTQSRARNFDLSVEMRLKFHESVLGCKKTIQYSQNTQCSTCVGSGARSNSDIVSCGVCGGSGIHTSRQGFMHIQVTCGTCNGVGKITTHSCTTCNGAGFNPEKREVGINVPCGVDEKSVLRIEGMGHFNPDIQKFDNLLVYLSIEKSSEFERGGIDILSSQQVPYVILALGGTLNISTVYGNTTASIQPGTPNNFIVKIRNYGIRLPNGENGSHFCKLMVEIPTKLNPEQKEALIAFQKTLT